MTHAQRFRWRSLVHGLATGAAMFAASGCYSYTPITAEVVPVGTRVVADLTDRGTVELADTVGGSAVSLSGRVESASPTDMVLSLNRVTFRQNRVATWGGERVGVPRQYVAQLRERKFSTARSIVTGAVVAVGVAFLIDRLGFDVGRPDRKSVV